MGHKQDKRAKTNFLVPFVFASLATIAIFALAITLLLPLSQTSGTTKFPLPAIVLAPLVLGALHMLAGFCALFVRDVVNRKTLGIYGFVGLYSYVLFHLYTYVAIGTWAGVISNGLTCANLAARRGSLLAELDAVPGDRRGDFGVASFMGLDAQTCTMVRWTWGLVVAAGVLNLLTAIGGYFLRKHNGSSQRSRPQHNGGGGRGGILSLGYHCVGSARLVEAMLSCVPGLITLPWLVAWTEACVIFCKRLFVCRVVSLSVFTVRSATLFWRGWSVAIYL